MHCRFNTFARMRSTMRVLPTLTAILLGISASHGFANQLVAAVARQPLSLPFYVAEAEGYFAAEGVQLRIEDCTFGRTCMEKLLSHQVSIATVADIPIVLSGFAGHAVSLLATISEAESYSKLLMRKSTAINAPRDLVGKRIGTVIGTGSQYLLDMYLIFNDIERRDVTVVEFLPEAAVAALAKSEIDALVIFEPYAFMAFQKLGKDAKILTTKRISHTTFNVVIDRRLAGPRDFELGKMLRALNRANRFIGDQPIKAQTILRTRLQLDQDFVDWIWKDTEYRLSLEQSLISSLESQARWAARTGFGNAAVMPNYLNYVYTTPLAGVLPAAVSIVK